MCLMPVAPARVERWRATYPNIHRSSIMHKSKNDSSSVRDVLAPTERVYSSRNFRGENIARLSEVAEKRRELEELENVEVAPYKMKKFEGVQSKVAAFMRPSDEMIAGRGSAAATAAVEGKKRVFAAPLAAIPAKFVRNEVVPRKASIPSTSELITAAERLEVVSLG